MRIRTFLFVAAAALAVATPTLADGIYTLGEEGQSWTYRPSTSPGIPTNRPRFTLQQRYDIRVMALKAKMERLATEDGGQLSLGHQASLQRELDDVNHWFKLKPAHS